MEPPASYKRQRPAVDPRYFWDDPDPNSTGLLLSDRILFYCERAHLIWPFDEQYVEPASYTLHAGSQYIAALRPGQYEVRNLEQEGKVTIPPNGLIYIRFFEEVNIPHYMIARFNLRVSQVYRGLLLGTGPQVDPGFRGYLGCPIHNFTDEEKTIQFFERLITIDFEKTTRLGQEYFSRLNFADLTVEQYGLMRAGHIPITGIDGKVCKIFDKRNNAEFHTYLPPGESIRSSVAALNEEVKRLDKTITIYRRVALGTLLGLFIAGVTVLFPLYTNLKDDIANRYMNLKGDIVELSKAVGRLEAARELVVPPLVGPSRGSKPQTGTPLDKERGEPQDSNGKKPRPQSSIEKGKK